jgi:hypothetical protein
VEVFSGRFCSCAHAFVTVLQYTTPPPPARPLPAHPPRASPPARPLPSLLHPARRTPPLEFVLLRGRLAVRQGNFLFIQKACGLLPGWREN